MTIDRTTWYLDTEYLGHENLIATGVLETDEGLLVVDPGPTTGLDTLTEKLEAAGAGWGDVHAVLLTHIHLDHAGATGTIVDRAADVQVYVHERGARHMVSPERLLKSAKRIYGDDMDRLWGEFQSVPEDNVHVLTGSETLSFGGRTLQVAYTPGHAQHHVSYLDERSGTAFIGDVGGMRVEGSDFIIPVMPPPDVDLEAWHESLDRVRTWDPDRIFVTHFGPHTDVHRHLDVMNEKVDDFAQKIRETLPAVEEDGAEAVAERFAESEVERIHEAVDREYWEAYERFGQPRDSWYGVARYWQKR